MATRKQSKGRCVYCGKELSKGGMGKHLAACAERKAAMTAAATPKAKSVALYHLRVQDAYQSDFWLDLELIGSEPLQVLDNYLRAIWLECCGHLSEFMLGRFTQEVSMRRKISDIFGKTDALMHIYDFGTSSETLIKCVGKRQGQPTTTHPITLMARNLMPDYRCMACGETATHLCLECQIEEGESGLLCDAHTESHPHDSYGEPMPLVNSPRTGMCGYTGPADPPY